MSHPTRRPLRRSGRFARYCLALIVSIPALQAESELQINEPASGTVVRPGQTLTVTVTTSRSYAELIISGTGSIGFSAPSKTPPYRFSLVIPSTTSPGRYFLTAVGADSSGRLSYSDQVSIEVERADRPIAIKVEPQNLRLFVGEKTALRVTGTYNDGATADLTKSTRTIYVSDSPDIVTVSNAGLVTAVGVGSARLIVHGNFQIPVTVYMKSK
jgi:hypothetical protein